MRWKSSATVRREGFTIIETTIAVAVLLFGVVGTYTFFFNVFRAAEDATRHIEGMYLAQEGVEIARNIRDRNILRSRTDPSVNWSKGLEACSQGCELDYQTQEYHQIMPYRGRFLVIGDGGLYGYGTGEETTFRRIIAVDRVPGISDVLKIDVTVTWFSGGKREEFNLPTYLYNLD